MAFSGGMGADLTKKQEDMFDAKDAYVPSLRLAASRGHFNIPTAQPNTALSTTFTDYPFAFVDVGQIHFFRNNVRNRGETNVRRGDCRSARSRGP